MRSIPHTNVFRWVFREVFRQVVWEVFRDAFRLVFRGVFRLAIQEVFREAFRKIGWLKKTLAKVVDFVPLGALSGPGAPDSDLGRFHIRA